jgi:hypothetical protein
VADQEHVARSHAVGTAGPHRRRGAGRRDDPARGTAPFGAPGGGAPAERPIPDLLGHGAFAECQGLELEADVKDLSEGGFNAAMVQRVGRVKLVPLVLKRGMFVVGGDPAGPARGAPGTAPGPGGRAGSGAGSTAGGGPGNRGAVDTALWDWLQGMVSGRQPVPRYNGIVEVRDPADRRVVARWVFTRGLPLKVTGPQLDATTGAVAVESLTIAHEGMRMEALS